MVVEKKNRIEEPKSRFYVRKWKASKKELSEVRDFVKGGKAKYNGRTKVLDSEKAKELRER